MPAQLDLSFIPTSDEQTRRWDREWLHYFCTEDPKQHMLTHDKLGPPASLAGKPAAEVYDTKLFAELRPLCVWVPGDVLRDSRNVFEIGCGCGFFGKQMGKLGKRYLGLDHSQLRSRSRADFAPAVQLCPPLRRGNNPCDGRHAGPDRRTLFFIHQNYASARWVLRLASVLLGKDGLVAADFWLSNPAIAHGIVHPADREPGPSIPVLRVRLHGRTNPPPGRQDGFWRRAPRRPARPAAAIRASPPEDHPVNVLMMVPDHLMIDRRVLQQAASLTRQGHKVDLLAGFECPAEASYEERGFHVYRHKYDWDDVWLQKIRRGLPQNERVLKFVNRAYMAAAWRLFRFSPFDRFVLAKAMQFPADVVHVHDLPLLRVAAELARRWNARLVYDAHEIYYEQDCLPPRNRRWLAAQERKYIGRVDLFTTVNEPIADHFQSLYGVRPLVLMNCADSPPPGFDRDSRRRLRQRAGLPENARVALFQGWISAERNLLTLVESAAQLGDDTAIVLIGYGDYEQVLRAAAVGKPWERRVRFIGKVDSAEILSLTAGADVGVIPYQPIDLNHRLCSPNKFFEFVQSGVPVVAHDLVFFRDMARRYGVVSVGDLSTAAGMAAAIRGVLDDRPRREQMQIACRKAAEVLNWETEAKQLLDAYTRLAHEKIRNPNLEIRNKFEYQNTKS